MASKMMIMTAMEERQMGPFILSSFQLLTY